MDLGETEVTDMLRRIRKTKPDRLQPLIDEIANRFTDNEEGCLEFLGGIIQKIVESLRDAKPKHRDLAWEKLRKIVAGVQRVGVIQSVDGNLQLSQICGDYGLLEEAGSLFVDAVRKAKGMEDIAKICGNVRTRVESDDPKENSLGQKLVQDMLSYKPRRDEVSNYRGAVRAVVRDLAGAIEGGDSISPKQFGVEWMGQQCLRYGYFEEAAIAFEHYGIGFFGTAHDPVAREEKAKFFDRVAKDFERYEVADPRLPKISKKFRGHARWTRAYGTRNMDDFKAAIDLYMEYGESAYGSNISGWADILKEHANQVYPLLQQPEPSGNPLVDRIHQRVSGSEVREVVPRECGREGETLQPPEGEVQPEAGLREAQPQAPPALAPPAEHAEHDELDNALRNGDYSSVERLLDGSAEVEDDIVTDRCTRVIDHLTAPGQEMTEEARRTLGKAYYLRGGRYENQDERENALNDYRQGAGVGEIRCLERAVGILWRENRYSEIVGLWGGLDGEIRERYKNKASEYLLLDLSDAHKQEDMREDALNFYRLGVRQGSVICLRGAVEMLDREELIQFWEQEVINAPVPEGENIPQIVRSTLTQENLGIWRRVGDAYEARNPVDAIRHYEGMIQLRERAGMMGLGGGIGDFAREQIERISRMQISASAGEQAGMIDGLLAKVTNQQGYRDVLREAEGLVADDKLDAALSVCNTIISRRKNPTSGVLTPDERVTAQAHRIKGAVFEGKKDLERADRSYAESLDMFLAATDAGDEHALVLSRAMALRGRLRDHGGVVELWEVHRDRVGEHLANVNFDVRQDAMRALGVSYGISGNVEGVDQTVRHLSAIRSPADVIVFWEAAVVQATPGGKFLGLIQRPDVPMVERIVRHQDCREIWRRVGEAYRATGRVEEKIAHYESLRDTARKIRKTELVEFAEGKLGELRPKPAEDEEV